MVSKSTGEDEAKEETADAAIRVVGARDGGGGVLRVERVASDGGGEKTHGGVGTDV